MLNRYQSSDLIDNTYANTKEVAKRQYDVIMDNGIIEVGNELILRSHTNDKGQLARCTTEAEY